MTDGGVSIRTGKRPEDKALGGQSVVRRKVVTGNT